jgi:hypothetical protein
MLFACSNSASLSGLNASLAADAPVDTAKPMHVASNAAPYFVLCFILIDYTPVVTDGYDCVAYGAAVLIFKY